MRTFFTSYVPREDKILVYFFTVLNNRATYSIIVYVQSKHDKEGV